MIAGDIKESWRAFARRTILALTAITIACASALIVASGVLAAWDQTLPGALNTAGSNAAQPDALTIDGRPHAAWVELTDNASNIRVSRIGADGLAWESVGANLNLAGDTNASRPSIAEIAGVPYVIWQEQEVSTGVFQIFVKRLDSGGIWSPVGSALNLIPTTNATSPAIANVAGTLYAAFRESDGTSQKIVVRRLSAGVWETVGGSPNVSPAADGFDPQITSDGSAPFVFWTELAGAIRELRAARLSMTTGLWETVGGALNAGVSTADQPRAAAPGGRPHVAWLEQQGGVTKLFVKRLTDAGDGWEDVAGPLNTRAGVSAFQPSLASVGDMPYVSHREMFNGINRLVVSRLDESGATWEMVGPLIGASSTGSPSLAAAGTVPWLTTIESSTHDDLVVRRLVPTVEDLTIVEAETAVDFRTSLDTYGISFPLRLKWGSANPFFTMDLGNATAQSTLSLTGLSPDTSYSFRLEADAGFNPPAVLAADGTRTKPLELPTDEADPTVQLTWSPKRRGTPTIAGRAVDSEGPIARVEVAVARERAGKCAWIEQARLTGDLCTRHRWQPVAGTEVFSLTLSRRMAKLLASSAYSVYARAFDQAGNVSEITAYRCVKPSRSRRGRGRKPVARCVEWQ